MNKNVELQDKILKYIKEHNGMSASVSVIGRMIDPNYGWKDFGKYSGLISTMKRNKLLYEDKGRYYINE